MRKILIAAMLIAGPAVAADPAGLLAGYQAEARKGDSAFNPSASRGEQFFTARRTEQMAVEISNEHTWSDRVDGHAVRGPLHRECAGQPGHP